MSKKCNLQIIFQIQSVSLSHVQWGKFSYTLKSFFKVLPVWLQSVLSSIALLPLSTLFLTLVNIHKIISLANNFTLSFFTFSLSTLFLKGNYIMESRTQESFLFFCAKTGMQYRINTSVQRPNRCHC